MIVRLPTNGKYEAPARHSQCERDQHFHFGHRSWSQLIKIYRTSRILKKIHENLRVFWSHIASFRCCLDDSYKSVQNRADVVRHFHLFSYGKIKKCVRRVYFRLCNIVTTHSIKRNIENGVHVSAEFVLQSWNNVQIELWTGKIEMCIFGMYTFCAGKCESFFHVTQIWFELALRNFYECIWITCFVYARNEHQNTIHLANFTKHAHSGLRQRFISKTALFFIK